MERFDSLELFEESDAQYMQADQEKKNSSPQVSHSQKLLSPV
jgi:hypothetical protein